MSMLKEALSLDFTCAEFSFWSFQRLFPDYKTASFGRRQEVALHFVGRVSAMKPYDITISSQKCHAF
jgi:hypothetical protein